MVTRRTIPSILVIASIAVLVQATGALAVAPILVAGPDLDCTYRTGVYSVRRDGSDLVSIGDHWLPASYSRAAVWDPTHRAVIVQAYDEGSEYGQLFRVSLRTWEAVLLTDDHVWKADPALSPDGRRLAIAGWRRGFTDIYVYSLVTGRRERLTMEEEFPLSDSQPAWSADGTRIIWAHGKELWTMRRQGGGKQPFTLQGENGAVHGSSPDWSRDGRLIAYSSGGDIHVVRQDGSHHRILVDDAHAALGRPEWSRDGRLVAYTRSAWNDSGCEDPYHRVFTVHADGSHRHFVTGDADTLDW